mgnify:CR=1 FL=1
MLTDVARSLLDHARARGWRGLRLLHNGARFGVDPYLAAEEHGGESQPEAQGREPP